MKKAFKKEMQNLDAAGLLRTETAVAYADNMQLCLDEDHCYLNFVDNDVFGLKYNKKVAKAAVDALKAYGSGSTSSRIAVGTRDIHQQLEQKLALVLGTEDCMVFASAYLANIGVFESLTNQRDSIFIDEMCNPGLYDGARLSAANVVAYRHRDYEQLEYHLKCSQGARYRLVVTDGVFSTSGESADLGRILKLKDTYDAIAVVDDSFAVGIMGDGGAGSFSHQLLENRAELISGSFSYALGNVAGGFICGDQELIDWLRHTSRAYLVSEPLPPANAAIVLKVLELLEQDQSIQEKLNSIAKYARNSMEKKGLKPIHNKHPMVKIKVGSTLRAQKLVEYLHRNNILASGLCYPNTPEGESLLKFNISVKHTNEQIDQLISVLEQGFATLEET